MDDTFVAIMQPTYLPWCGYFDLIDQASAFVFLDTVQFDKRSWQQRNRIRGPQGLIWLTVPVKVKGRYLQRICDVEISSSSFARKHTKAMELNYRRAPFFNPYFGLFASVLNEGYTLLSELNVSLIRLISRLLGLDTEFVFASDLPIQGKRGEYLAELCRCLGFEQYLTPAGSVDYLLADVGYFTRYGIDIHVQDYMHPVYRQLFEPFLPYASVIDLLFNEGPDSICILRKGRRQPVPLQRFVQDRHEAKLSMPYA